MGDSEYKKLRILYRNQILNLNQKKRQRFEKDKFENQVDEKCVQLQYISILAALVAGFMVCAETNINIPQDLDARILIAFALFSSLTISIFFVSMIVAVFLIMTLYRYDYDTSTLTFEEYWDINCELEWKLTFLTFTYGIPLFLCAQGMVGFVAFYDVLEGAVVASSVVVAFSGVAICIFWYKYYLKWEAGLVKGNDRITVEQQIDLPAEVLCVTGREDVVHL